MGNWPHAGALLLPLCPEPKHAGEDSLPPPEPAFSSLSMDIVYHQALGLGEGRMKVGRKPQSYREEPRAFYTVREGREGKR